MVVMLSLLKGNDLQWMGLTNMVADLHLKRAEMEDLDLQKKDQYWMKPSKARLAI